MWRQTVLLLAAVLLMSGCALLQKKGQHTVVGIRFHNVSYHPIGDVRLHVERIKGFASCSRILPKSICSTTFPVREYQGNPVIISWNQNGKTWTTGEIAVKLPEGASRDKPLFCVVEIGNQGSHSVSLAQ